MMFRSHLLWGSMAGYGTYLAVPLPLSAESILFYAPSVLFGTLLPDIDHPKSKLGRKVPWLSQWLYDRYGHRDMTHSMLIATLVCLPFFFIHPLIGTGLLIGYLTHIACDFFGDRGVPIFWPVKQRLGIRLYFTGSLAETLLNVFGFIGFLLAIGVLQFGIHFPTLDWASLSYSMTELLASIEKALSAMKK